MIARVTGVVYIVFGLFVLVGATQAQPQYRTVSYLVAAAFIGIGVWRFVTSFRK